MKEDKTIIRYPTFKVVQKENGKYWYKPVKGDEEEVLLIYKVPTGTHDPNCFKRSAQSDISGVSCDGKYTMYFVEGKTFKTGSPEMVSTIYDIISNYAEEYEQIGSGIYPEYILNYLRSMPETILMGLGYIVSDNAEFLDAYPCDLLEAIKDYWRYMLVIMADQDDMEYDYNIIFTDSSVVYNELGQKRIRDKIDRDRPLFPF